MPGWTRTKDQVMLIRFRGRVGLHHTAAFQVASKTAGLR
jgi:hypothetical protein